MRILLITAHFPHYDTPGLTYATPFLADYAIEWVKQGHEVKIIHMERVYPICFNLIAKFLSCIKVNRFEKFVVDRAAYTEKQYKYKGIIISRYLYKKFIPHSSVGRIQLSICKKKIEKDLYVNSFSPDIVIGDCVDPVLPIIKSLHFRNCVKAQIIHTSDFPYLEKDIIIKSFDSINKWIIRSEPQRLLLKNIIKNNNIITMFSGISKDIVFHEPYYRNNIKNLIYVGALYKTKGLETILRALSDYKADFTLTIIGKGSDEFYLKKIVQELNLVNIVKFVGGIPHERVFSYMAKADALLLVSRETFGMVYIEAMSQGCIPVGTIGEGIDGVVQHGKNGFLTELGDSKKLVALLRYMKKLSKTEIETLSKNAYETSKKMSQEELSVQLLNDLLKGEENEIISSKTL